MKLAFQCGDFCILKVYLGTFLERNEILDGFLEDVSGTKVEKVYRCRRKNIFF